jgi:hypothetical protein
MLSAHAAMNALEERAALTEPSSPLLSRKSHEAGALKQRNLG